MAFRFPLTDAHVHPDFSTDAEGSVEEYCDRALDLGLAELIFTTHVDTDPKYPDENVMLIDGKTVKTGVDSLTRYAETIWKAKEKYYNLGLMVKCGVEVSFFPELDEGLLKALSDPEFEYVLAAVHRIGDVCLGYEDESLALFNQQSVEEILERYYSLVRLAPSFGVFDAVAHLDYYRRFAPKEEMDQCLRVDFDFVTETLNLLAETELAIEVNTSAIRHGQKEYYPSMALLNLARKAGVQIRHIGSDAHRPEQLAFDFHNAEFIVYETNIDYMHEG